MSHIYKKEKCRSMKREMWKHEKKNAEAWKEKCRSMKTKNVKGRSILLEEQKFGNDINLLYQDIASLKWAIPHFKKQTVFSNTLKHTGLA